MIDFSDIFARHFFSNHHIEAKTLESLLEQLLTDFECVSFSSLPGLLVATVDELCDDEAKIYTITEKFSRPEHKLLELNQLLKATGRRQLLFKGEDEQVNIFRRSSYNFSSIDMMPTAVLIDQFGILGMFLDLATKQPILLSAGIFVTRNKKLAEKIRWSRSSYGRRENAVIKIAANGRFSELQAHLVISALQPKK